jgi:hypothetical protein
MLPYWGKKRKGKGERGTTLGSHVKGRPEDVATTDSRSRVASRLTRGGRQPVGPVEPKDCLRRILLWRSNRVAKWNGLRKRDSWTERKLWRRSWAAAV